MAKKAPVQHTATVGVNDTTLKDITDAQKSVGAPDTARVTTGGYYHPDPEVDALPLSLTFSWTE